MHTKKQTKIDAMIVLSILFISSITAGVSALSVSRNATTVDKESGDQNIVELQGSIDTHVFGERFQIIYPTINISASQSISLNTTQVNDTYVVNGTLRIHVNTPFNHTTSKRYLTVFATVMRKNQPLISGLLRDLFLGRKLTRINVFSENENDTYVDVPLQYEAKQQDEEQRIFILAIGNVIGLLMKSPPVVQFKTVDIACHYSAPVEDTIPPVTKIYISGDLAEGYENVYIQKVGVSFTAYDDDGTAQGTPVRYTTFKVSYSTVGGVEQQTEWLTYADPFQLNTTGTYQIDYYSVDRAGNFESPQTENFEIR